MSDKKMPSRQNKFFIALCLSFLFLSVLFVNVIKFNTTREENKGEIKDEEKLHYEVKLSPENEHQEGSSEETESRQGNVEKEFFLGIYGDKIAVFSRQSTGEVTLEEILPYLVKSVYYDELIKGIPFYSQEEKFLLLENLTS